MTSKLFCGVYLVNFVILFFICCEPSPESDWLRQEYALVYGSAVHDVTYDLDDPSEIIAFNGIYASLAVQVHAHFRGCTSYPWQLEFLDPDNARITLAQTTTCESIAIDPCETVHCFTSSHLAEQDEPYFARLVYPDGFLPTTPRACGDSPEEIQRNEKQTVFLVASRRPRFSYLLNQFGTTERTDNNEELRIELEHTFLPALAPIEDFSQNRTWMDLREGPGSLTITNLSSGEVISGSTEVVSQVYSPPNSSISNISFVFQSAEPESACTGDCTLEIRIKGPIASKNEFEPDPKPFSVDGDDWVLVLPPDAYRYQSGLCEGDRRYYIYRHPLPASLDPNR